VLVDTSVWADYLNGHPSAQADALDELLGGDHEVCTCGVVVAEVFQGLRQEAKRERIAGLFRLLTFFEPEGFDPYFRAADLYRELRASGYTVRSTIDCVIAVLAAQHGASVLAKDRDLAAILASNLLEVEAWPPPSSNA
jgi:predicted nucleic acid-binding protein